jgi:hypothetical protein
VLQGDLARVLPALPQPLPWSSAHTLEERLDCSGVCCRSAHVSERFILRVPRERHPQREVWR